MKVEAKRLSNNQKQLVKMNIKFKKVNIYQR